MVRPVEVRPLENYRLWLRYQDGTEGEVDLSYLAGKGVFVSWQQEGVFARSSSVRMDRSNGPATSTCVLTLCT